MKCTNTVLHWINKISLLKVYSTLSTVLHCLFSNKYIYNEAYDLIRDHAAVTVTPLP
jgi:hypothetical protein